MSIHPTAIIDPKAELGTDVVVGPYCVIGPDVVIGDGCWLQNHVTVCGPSKIGKRNRFHAYGRSEEHTSELQSPC